MSQPAALHPLFRVAAAFTLLFVITIMALAACMLGDPNAPAGKFLDRYGGILLAGEVAAIIVSGLAAMILDRMKTLRERAERRDGK